jgi:hypothetical protein
LLSVLPHTAPRMLENVAGGANDLVLARICLRGEFSVAAQPPPLLARPRAC